MASEANGKLLAAHDRLVYILVMTFKRRRLANTAMQANSAMPMFLTTCQTEIYIYIYGNMAESKFFDLCKTSYFTYIKY